jgi:hypothetical protein
VHPLYEYSGSGDPTRESARNLSREEVNWWLAQLFDLTGYHGEGVQVDNATALGMPKITSSCNFDM